MKFEKTYLKFNGFNHNELDLIKKRENNGLLDGLIGYWDMSENFLFTNRGLKISLLSDSADLNNETEIEIVSGCTGFINDIE